MFLSLISFDIQVGIKMNCCTIRTIVTLNILIAFSCGDSLDKVKVTYNFPSKIHLYNFKKEIKSHPMLLFDNSFLPAFLKQARTTHRHIAKDIEKAVDFVYNLKYKSQKEPDLLPPESQEKFASKWNEKYGNTLPVLAMHFYLNQNDGKLLDFIQLFMDRMASYDSWYVAKSPAVSIVHYLYL